MKWSFLRRLLGIQVWDIDDLKPLNNSPIHTNDKRRREMREKIRREGQQGPIWCDRDGYIISNQLEWRVLKRLGVRRAYVFVVG